MYDYKLRSFRKKVTYLRVLFSSFKNDKITPKELYHVQINRLHIHILLLHLLMIIITIMIIIITMIIIFVYNY